MASHTQHRLGRGRVWQQRRHIRIHGPEAGPLEVAPLAEGSTLPVLRPALCLQVHEEVQREVVGRRRIRATPAAASAAGGGPRAKRSISSLVQTVIAAVNARGLCAAQAARIAELPVSEVEDIASRCACPACRGLH